MFADLNGKHLSPEHCSKSFGDALAQCRKELPDLTAIVLHGLRHAHATILRNGVPVHVVSARLGHSSPMITLTIYAHVFVGDDQAAVSIFAALVGDAATRPEVSPEYHGAVQETAQMHGASR